MLRSRSSSISSAAGAGIDMGTMRSAMSVGGGSTSIDAEFGDFAYKNLSQLREANRCGQPGGGAHTLQHTNWMDGSRGRKTHGLWCRRGPFRGTGISMVLRRLAESGVQSPTTATAPSPQTPTSTNAAASPTSSGAARGVRRTGSGGRRTRRTPTATGAALGGSRTSTSPLHDGAGPQRVLICESDPIAARVLEAIVRKYGPVSGLAAVVVRHAHPHRR